eukprot:1134489-Pelagomonas_calceolata.AAC.1
MEEEKKEQGYQDDEYKGRQEMTRTHIPTSCLWLIRHWVSKHGSGFMSTMILREDTHCKPYPQQTSIMLG